MKEYSSQKIAILPSHNIQTYGILHSILCIQIAHFHHTL